jgi:hypothetical protein
MEVTYGNRNYTLFQLHIIFSILFNLLCFFIYFIILLMIQKMSNYGNRVLHVPELIDKCFNEFQNELMSSESSYAVNACWLIMTIDAGPDLPQRHL